MNLYPYEDLGHANLGWLDTRHHFSFGQYFNPKRMGFGALRVINDDVIKPGSGFDMHPHRNMEIITFVRHGAITHRDSRGNKGRTEAGDVQVMSAGSGIFHSEFNLESEDTVIFQIWIEPKEKNIQPRWEAARFSGRRAADGKLPLLVSGRAEDEGKGAIYIHQDASIHGGMLAEGQSITQPVHGQAYLVISAGTVEIDGHVMKKGAGMEIMNIPSVTIKARNDAEIILIDVPKA